MAAKPNFLERAWAYVAPVTALERAKAKSALTMFGYDAANPDTLRGGSGGPSKNGSPESAMMNRDRERLIWDARDLERNSPVFSGILSRISQYICHRLEYKADTGDKEIDDQYEEYFHQWCGRADITGRHRLKELCKLAIRSMVRDGDIGFVISKRGGDIKLQAIEADRIGNGSKEGMNTPKKQGGFVLDDDGKPVKVRIYKRTVTNQYEFDYEEDMDNFIHLFMPSRVDQYRGISALAPVLADGRDAHELIGFEKQACKFQSAIAGFQVMKDPASTTGAGGWDTPASNGAPAMLEVVPGQIRRVSEDSNIVFPPGAQRPSGAFMQFHEVLIRRIANGLNWPFGFLWDMSGLGGATSRIEVMQAQRRIQELQEILVETMLDRVKNLAIAHAIASNQLPATKNWKRGRFTFGAWLTADVGYQTQSDMMLIQMGMKSRHQWGAENDCDFDSTTDDVLGELKHFQKKAAEYNIPMELIPGQNPMASPLLAAMQQSKKPASALMPQEPPPPPGLLGQVGDKGIKPLLEINTQVAQGILPRDTAIIQVSAIFGITPEEADIMVSRAPVKKVDGKEDEE